MRFKFTTSAILVLFLAIFQLDLREIELLGKDISTLSVKIEFFSAIQILTSCKLITTGNMSGRKIYKFPNCTSLILIG